MKTVMYFKQWWLPSNFDPSSYKRDNKYVSDNWKWNGSKWIYY